MKFITRFAAFKTITLLTTVVQVLLLNACAMSDRQSIGSLHKVDIDIKERHIEGSLEKALGSYQHYLQETSETGFTPEAIRRIADLKIKQAHRAEEGEYNAVSNKIVTLDAEQIQAEEVQSISRREVASGGVVPLAAAEITAVVANAGASMDLNRSGVEGEKFSESDQAFAERAALGAEIASDGRAPVLPGDSSEQLLAANAREAISLYKKLLHKYPLYDRNDQVMYQLSRVYDETGETDQAINILGQLVSRYPQSRHLDEAYFRLGEYHFVRKKYLDAEEYYGKVITIGVASNFYELALYKRGWSLFKQEMYELALNDYVRMLDYKVDQGYDFEQQANDVERKHVEDTFRVLSLSFSYLGGADSIVHYFTQNGGRSYESNVYSHLGEYYLDKRRYQDAADAYNTFIASNALHKVSPDFSIRVIEIYLKGGFPRLVLEAKKEFATTYALNARYWSVFDISEYAEVVKFQQDNLIDLASHYHAAYQDKRLKDQKSEHYQEAIHWYRAYLLSFADQSRAPDINYQLAGLLLENKDFQQAALEYERTAYQYSAHENASEAGYAAVFAYREHLKKDFSKANASEKSPIQKEIIRSSLTFAETFPQHAKVTQIMLGAVDDLYVLKDFAKTLQVGHLLLKTYPQATVDIRRSAWLLIAHASFDTAAFMDAEAGYQQALKLTPSDGKGHAELIDNLAAAIYQQGDAARKLEEHQLAADNFLRIRDVAPGSSILATAEYDAATALILLENWSQAAGVLKAFRSNHRQHKLLNEVTKKLAVVYQQGGELLLAGAEFERIERESEDEAVRREALTQAATLYETSKHYDKAITALRRYVKLFPQPAEPALETRSKMSEIYLQIGNNSAYVAELQNLVTVELQAGKGRTERTRFLAGNAALTLAEPKFNAFTKVALKAPLEKNLNRKRKLMKKALDTYTNLIDYQVADVTAAATFYLAEIYFHFSFALKESERPDNLSAAELEDYELALEEQIYPFEEKAISVHEKNIALLRSGIYNPWVEKSIGKLAAIVPARYARQEDFGNIMQTIVPLVMEQQAADKAAIKEASNNDHSTAETVSKI